MVLTRTRRQNPAPPERPRATAPTPLPPLPLGAPARAVGVLAGLYAAEPTPVEQVRAAYDQTMRKIWAIWHMAPLNKDWSARIAADWKHLDARWDNLAGATAREYARLHLGAEYEVQAWTAPILSELTELTVVRVPEWRKALTVAADAELALYGTESGS